MPDQTTQDWTQAWMDAQRNTMETWMNLTRQGAENMAAATRPAPPRNPYEQSLDLWWRMATSGLPTEERKLSDRLLEVNKSYLQLGEQFWQLAQGAQSAADAGRDWQKVLLQQMEQWRDAWGQQAKSPMADWATLWGMPTRQWQQMATQFMPRENLSSFGAMPGFGNMPGSGSMPGPEMFQQWMQKFSDLPAVGYTRESQEDWQKWTQLWANHVEAIKRYEKVMRQVTQRTFDLMTEKLLEMSREGASLDSLRAAYDLWVDYSEVAYGEIANGGEFAEVQAQMTNTMMAMRQHAQAMLENVLRAWDLPTRSELNTAHLRIRELRKEVRELKQQMAATGLSELHDKIDQLRAEIRTAPKTTTRARKSAASEG